MTYKILIERGIALIFCISFFTILPYHIWQNSNERHWYEEQGMIITKGVCTKKTGGSKSKVWLRYKFILNDSVFRGYHDVGGLRKYGDLKPGDSVSVKYSKINHSFHYLN